jgi:hypothetical protein
MKKYGVVIMLSLLVLLLFALSVVSQLKAPYVEYSLLPRCSNEVVVTDELRVEIIKKATDMIKTGTGAPYFNNYFIFKNLDYSISNCVFVARYEYTYDVLHTEMSVTMRVFDTNNIEVTETNTFLRPVGLLVSSADAEGVTTAQNTTYSYYNVVIDTNKQTFLYKFYRDTLTEGTVLVLVLDGQSKEITEVTTVKEFVPIV